MSELEGKRQKLEGKRQELESKQRELKHTRYSLDALQEEKSLYSATEIPHKLRVNIRMAEEEVNKLHITIAKIQEDIETLQAEIAELKPTYTTEQYKEQELCIKTENQQQKHQNLRSRKRIGTFVFGVILIAIILNIAYSLPYPTIFQIFVCRVALALSVAVIVPIIPGLLKINVSSYIRIGGAMILFILVSGATTSSTIFLL